MKQCLLLALCWFAFSAEGACSSDTKTKNYPGRIVLLQKKHSDSFLYYRIGHYVIVVEPATLVRRLEKQAARREALSDRRLLGDIRGNMSRTGYRDLFAFVLKDPLYFLRIELLLADVLQHGEASVVDAYELPGASARFLTEIILIKIEEDAYKGREFCTPTGDLLLRITDEID